MPAVTLEVKEQVAIITLNREEKLNALNGEMCMQLQDLLSKCEADALVKAVYVTGAGRAFSAGQDLEEAVGMGKGALEKILSERLNPIVRRIRNLPKPVIAAVPGVAAGAGANIALACDIVLASESAVFIQAFSKIALIPDSGGTFFLPRLIGWQRAAAVMMLGDKVSAAEAERWGMVYKVFPDERFQEESMRLTARLAAMPASALALTKEALNRSTVNNFEEQLKAEEELQVKAGSSNDFAAAVKAFVGKKQKG
jgi:2-(1,2-epoxy-1,2-dihydrophenyl)acetyl-CoA isomerase